VTDDIASLFSRGLKLIEIRDAKIIEEATSREAIKLNKKANRLYRKAWRLVNKL